MKKILKNVSMLVVAGLIIVVGIYFFELYNYVEGYELGQMVEILIEERAVNDYTVLEDKTLEVIDQKLLERLKTYMKENNLRLKCGNYEVNSTYTYDEVLEVLKFEDE